MANSTGLVIEDLAKTYGNGVRALDSVSLRVPPGMYGLLGPNGAGKSTLMRTLATLQEPDRGRLFLDGEDVLAAPDHLRQRLGYLPQQIGAYAGVPARDLLNRFAWLKGRHRRSERQEEVEILLEKVNLREVAHRPASTFSGGMLRRFGIALALIGSPRLLIVDEPTAGLDPAERNQFHRVLADTANNSVVLLSTHIVEDVENLCDRLAILANGRLLAEGTPAALTLPYQGMLWEASFERDEPVPEEALRVLPQPGGRRVICHAERAPDDRFVSRPPRLEDVYYLALENAGRGTAA